MHDVCAARALVQVVDVLRDDLYGLRWMIAHEVGDGDVPSVWRSLHDFHAPPFVPAPHLRLVGAIALWRGECGGIESLPQTGERVAKGGNAALGRHARAREKGDAICCEDAAT